MDRRIRSMWSLRVVALMILGGGALACANQDLREPRSEGRGNVPTPEAQAGDTSGSRAAAEQPGASPQKETTPMQEQLDFYTRRLRSTGLALEAADMEHEPVDLGALAGRAFKVTDTDIYLELLAFEHASHHKAAIDSIKASGWGSESYWLPATSGGVLLLARAPAGATAEVRGKLNELVAAFAGEE